MRVKPEEVDVRLVLGEPIGEQPFKVNCPVRIHKARIGQEDDKSSMAVYRGNIHCFGCGFHIRRRYASIAFLLGLWDGIGDEDSLLVGEKVKEAKKQLPGFINRRRQQERLPEPEPLDPYMDLAFHQFLLRCKPDRLMDELMTKRGLTLGTIKERRIGHTGTHFTIPVYSVDGRLVTIRYRADEAVCDIHAPDYRKYEGTWRRNDPVLYPLPVLRGIHALEELWIVEGEFDAIASNQEGAITLTVTNGAGSISKIVELILFGLPQLSIKRFVVATDQDGAGDAAAASVLSILSDLGLSGVRARWRDAKDLNEFYAVGNSRKGIWYEG